MGLSIGSLTYNPILDTIPIWKKLVAKVTGVNLSSKATLTLAIDYGTQENQVKYYVENSGNKELLND
ncbi:678_t:CDS:2 [Entrophospora sp. SA101]|nr:678_t:CDS:2 [Entrophospora sp. SA101]